MPQMRLDHIMMVRECATDCLSLCCATAGTAAQSDESGHDDDQAVAYMHACLYTIVIQVHNTIHVFALNSLPTFIDV